jgi:purine-nucleoside phosphorylase
MQGRFHFYEGYDMKTITYPVRLIKEMGAEYLVVSNASGGLNPLFSRGDIMLITDHINLMGDNPLRGRNDPALGVRFPDMSEPYTLSLRKQSEKTALEMGQKLVMGVYVGLMGPNLETPAEYRFLRKIGADAVGMSTVPEVIVAVHSGMKVLGFSIITDMCLPDALEPTSLEIILKTASMADGKLSGLIAELFKKKIFHS